jgi:hypothetical protein
MASKSENIYYLALVREIMLTFDLDAKKKLIDGSFDFGK